MIYELNNSEGEYIGMFYPASSVSVDKVLKQPITSEAMDHGRSPWQWFRLGNGDLIFGCFPKGELYEELERYVDSDYVAAHQ